MDTAREERSLGSLVSDLTRESSELMRKEVELAKAEISSKVSQVQHSLIALAVGAALILVGLFYILDAVVYGIAELLPADLSPWLAALVVGLVVGIIGYGLLKKGQHDLEPGNLAPRRTAESLQKDKRMLEEKIS